MTKREPIKVILPDHPPALTPQAVRALLRILLDAPSTWRRGRPTTIGPITPVSAK